MRVLLISDIHGNYEALKAVIDKVGRFDDGLVLGDLVDYGPDPDTVIDLIKSLGFRVIKGNHDEAAALNIDCGCGEKTHAVSVYTRQKITLRKLSKNDLNWLRNLPYEAVISELDAVAVRASPKNKLYAYIYPWMGKEEIHRYIGEDVSSRYLLVGHTHYQFTEAITNELTLLNPGSVGQPRDGDWRAAYALIDTSEGTVTMGRVKYDVSKVTKKLKEIVRNRKYLLLLSSILQNGNI